MSNTNWVGRTPNEHDPKFLYKYCTLDSYKKRLLERGEIYFAKPSDLNDPFDCKISPNFDEIDDQTLERHIRLILAKQLEGKSAFQQHLEIKEWLTNFKTSWKDSTFKEERLLNYHAGNDKYVGLISYSLNYSHHALWGHYSKSHSGIMIVYDFKKLFAEIHEAFKIKNSSSGLFYSKVKYQEYPKDISPLIDNDINYLGHYYLTLFSFKSLDWKFEDEYRLVAFPLKERILQIANDCIVEVIAGFQISKKDLDFLKSISKDRFTLKKAVPSLSSFELHYELVQDA